MFFSRTSLITAVSSFQTGLIIRWPTAASQPGPEPDNYWNLCVNRIIDKLPAQGRKQYVCSELL